MRRLFILAFGLLVLGPVVADAAAVGHAYTEVTATDQTTTSGTYVAATGASIADASLTDGAVYFVYVCLQIQSNASARQTSRSPSSFSKTP